MFTGIVEGKGEVVSVERAGRGLRLAVEMGELVDGVRPGDSVCVSGVCLTVARVDGSRLFFDAVEETVRRTTLADARPRVKVNLERAVRPTDRLGGHIVTGHVDGAGVVRKVVPRDEGKEMTFLAPEGVERLIAEKGSVAVDGVSLTVAAVRGREFTVALVPHTLRVTTLGELAPGRRVNIEADVIARYVARSLER